jgi:glutamine---fructose-6-phosphate transaminase (isomerizing)
MCAIFGFIARKDASINLKTLAAIVKGNIRRGPHAFGFSWIDPDGRLHCYKQAGALTDHLEFLGLLSGARIVIGHLRYATHGDVQSNINNHPHAADGGWIVHNGMIGNYRQLAREQGLPMVSECDSEVLGLMIEQGRGKLLDRCSDAVVQADGGLTMMGLWARPATLIVARRGNPLTISDTVDGLYLASLENGLPGKTATIRDDTIRVYRHEGQGVIHQKIVELPVPEIPITDLDEDDQAGPETEIAPSRWLNSRGQLCSGD